MKKVHGSRERRLKASLKYLMGLYKEPGLVLVNYTVRRKIRGILGRALSKEVVDHGNRYYV